MKAKTKAFSNQLKHAKKRLKERFGINLDESLYNFIVKRIQQGGDDKVHLVKKSTCTRSIWDVKVNDSIVRFVYSNKHKSLITALFPYNNDMLAA